LTVGAIGGGAFGATERGLGTDSVQYPVSGSYALANFSNPVNHGGAPTYGAEVGYRFHGLIVGFLAQEVKIPFKDDVAAIGQLHMNATMFTLGYQSRPRKGRGAGWHTMGGIGFARTSFVPDARVAALSQSWGAPIDISTVDPTAGMCGLGFDYFASPYVSITLFDMRGFWATTNTTWTIARKTPLNVIDVNPLYGSNFQVLFGLRFWIH
jgi:hypothetical protein